jgi:hypothetical protein
MPNKRGGLVGWAQIGRFNGRNKAHFFVEVRHESGWRWEPLCGRSYGWRWGGRRGAADGPPFGVPLRREPPAQACQFCAGVAVRPPFNLGTPDSPD